MSFIRSDQLIALQSLLVASKTTVDHFNDVAEFIDDRALGDKMRCFAQTRSEIIGQLEQAIYALDDLPAEPDSDKETSEMLLNRARAALSSDEINQVVQQRLIAEQELGTLLELCQKSVNTPAQEPLLHQLQTNIEVVVAQLTKWLADN